MLRRGDVVTCVLSGDYGKPRPALVIQSDLFNEFHASVTVCPFTTHLQDAPLFRIQVEPEASNGLQQTSQLMTDKITTLKREKISHVIGRLSEEKIQEVEEAIRLWLDLE